MKNFDFRQIIEKCKTLYKKVLEQINSRLAIFTISMIITGIIACFGFYHIAFLFPIICTIIKKYSDYKLGKQINKEDILVVSYGAILEQIIIWLV